MSVASKPSRRPLTEARTKTPLTLFVCKSCSHGADLRREIKAAIKAAGRKRQLRVVGCSCIDICPSRGTAVIVASKDAGSRCLVIDDRASIDNSLLAALLDERVRDAISN